ncbi:methylamine methyltransferase corrinoid protein reductive activase [Methanolobus halotolerans]|uniref:4Fe-4S ferredoxin n=1 Tax=Methanolobus halotolerans TaxID=2052935 RepID=A0A4E0Q078_9EURY|nr:methylamine methyltransferase corrinoid protein reductive activase [Methanolobus halotolerans]TGC11427.1 4Fe-4S ferredoxin [Methanolobus halotolerans]
MRTGVAIDLGTSGIRAQKIDLDSGDIKKTVITLRNPLPGANVMDHLDFAITYGLERAHGLHVNAVRKIIEALGVEAEELQRMAICGNPIQLSIFQGIPIDDLAYAGERKKEKLNIKEENRDARIVDCSEITGLEVYPNAKLVVPPAIRHEVGADALALIIKSGFLDTQETAIATDYGTNAEMALIHEGTIYTGSAAAGPALEGQQIKHGKLASPFVISDVEFENDNIRNYVLDDEMNTVKGKLIDPRNGDVVEDDSITAKGITGTGVIAIIDAGMKNGIIQLPKINTPDHILYLQDKVKFFESDVQEAGLAIGAIRAGHLALCNAAGIEVAEVKKAYMSGAAGTYMDAIKAHQIGMVPYSVDEVIQIGNTSLIVAREVLLSEDRLWELQEIASRIVSNHVMFATDQGFKEAYIQEISYWTEGMPFKMLKKFLKKKKLPQIDLPDHPTKVDKRVEKDIPVLGEEGLDVLEQVGTYLTMKIDCPECQKCAKVCPTDALSIDEEGLVMIRSDLCDGANCKRCINACPKDKFKWENLEVMEIAE